MAQSSALEPVSGDTVTIRRIENDDLFEVDQMWKDDGWKMGMDNLKWFYHLWSESMFVASKDGHIFGTGFVFLLDDTIAVFGLDFVRAGYRGRGIFQQLWKRRMECAGARNVCINAMLGRVSQNQQLGFKILSWEATNLTGVPNISNLQCNNFLIKLVKIRDANLGKLVEYDKSIHPIRRENFIKSLLERKEYNGLVAFLQDEVVGYTMVYPTDEPYYHIAPLYANDLDISKALFLAIVKEIPDDVPVRMHIPDPNTDWREVADMIGLKPTGTFRRMFNRKNVPIPTDKTYAVSNAACMLC